MNTQGNLYTFVYASVLVVVVAAILSFTAITLQPIQEKNVRIEKIQNILSSVGIENTVDNAEALFDKHIIDSYVLDLDGNKLESEKAFDIKLAPQVKLMYEVMKLESGDKNNLEIDVIKKQRKLPVYVCDKNGKKNIIIPIRGKGLWGPLWGYIALEMDYNTIFGAVFDHKAETPGLGADINQDWFQDPFKGKTIFDKDMNFTSIIVYKGGKGASVNAGDIDHGVDAISGGTITSKGLEAMVRDCLKGYAPFLKNQKSKN